MQIFKGPKDLSIEQLVFGLDVKKGTLLDFSFTPIPVVCRNGRWSSGGGIFIYTYGDSPNHCWVEWNGPGNGGRQSRLDIRWSINGDPTFWQVKCFDLSLRTLQIHIGNRY